MSNTELLQRADAACGDNVLFSWRDGTYQVSSWHMRWLPQNDGTQTELLRLHVSKMGEPVTAPRGSQIPLNASDLQEVQRRPLSSEFIDAAEFFKSAERL